MKVRRLEGKLIVCLFFLWILGSSCITSATAQGEQGLGLALSLDVITDFTSDGGTAYRFYPHEDISAIIYVINHGQQPAPVETPNFDWRRQLRVNLERWNGAAGEAVIYHPSKWVSQPAHIEILRAPRQIRPSYRKPNDKIAGAPERLLDPTLLAPGEEIVAVVAVTDANGKRPKPGVYRVAVALGPSGRFGRTIDFEVREVLTERDRKNSFFHQGVRARWAKKYNQAERALKELLVLNPNSTAAYSEMGAVAQDGRNYQRAIEFYRKTISLIEAGTDPDLHKDKTFREEWVAGLQQAIEKCQRLAQEKD
jgi:hypothetical protein